MKTFNQILFILFLFSSTLFSKDLEKVSLRLDWLHQFQFAGYYMAKEKGFFQENGLDVEIKEFNYGVDQIQEVLDKKSTYAVGKSSLIIDRLEGKKVLALAAMFQESPMVLLTKKDSNIKTPKDLLNKKVMLTPDARSAVAINSMIVSQGLKLEDINFQPHSFKLDDLINGTTDAMGCYLSNEPFLLQQRGVEFNTLNPKDFGFEFYGGILFTSDDELKDHPNRLHNFYSAVLKGWSYAFENIDETVEIILTKYNTQNKTKDALRFEGYALKQLAHYDQGQLGKLDLKKIKEIMKIYLLLGLTPLNNQDIKEFIFNQNRVLITPSEQRYLDQTNIKYSSKISKPFTYFEEGTLQGIEVEYFNAITNLTDMKSTTLQHSNKEALEMLEKRQIDIKPANSYKDLEANFARLSKPISEYKIAIATLIDKKYIPNTSFLENKRVAICKHCLIYKDILNDYPNIKLVKVNNLEQGLELLSQRKVYAVIDSLPKLIHHIAENGFTNVKISGTTEYYHKVRFMVHKDNTQLLSIINKSIDKLTQEKINQIDTRYVTVKYDVSKDHSWVYKVALPLLLVIVIIIIANLRLKKEIKKRVLAENNLHMIANTDELTQAYNRRKIDELYENHFTLAKRYARPLSVIFFDIDDFKGLNDSFGHKKADEVLIELSSMIKANIRSTDSFGRWGGDEFIIILPETLETDAYTMAQNLKAMVESHNFPVSSNVSCSFGVTSLHQDDSTDDLLTRVDHAMYEVKKSGKNGVKLV